MEDRKNAKDIAALFEKAGLRNGGPYREFPGRRKLNETLGETTLLDVNDIPTGSLQSVSNVDINPWNSTDRGATALDRIFSGGMNRGVNSSSCATSLRFFSLAGGVGKTMFASTLAAILISRSRRVVLANLGGSFAMRHLYGPHSQQIGPFTLLHAQKGDLRTPLTLIEAGDSDAEMKQAFSLIEVAARGADAIVLDCQTGAMKRSGGTLGEAHMVFIPVLPDMQSVVTLQSVGAAVRSQFGADCDVHYILNRYDATRASHREMHARIQKMLGDALAPVLVRDDPAVQDAAASGLTVVDYAPNSDVVRDLHGIADWVERMLPSSTIAKGMTA